MAEKLLERMRRILRTGHYSYRTEQPYLGWAKRFIRFHDRRHPAEMGKAEVEAFLSHLAVDRNVAPATQNQALNGILFLYRRVLARIFHQGDRRWGVIYGYSGGFQRFLRLFGGYTLLPRRSIAALAVSRPPWLGLRLKT